LPRESGSRSKNFVSEGQKDWLHRAKLALIRKKAPKTKKISVYGGSKIKLVNT
jgi:hypothetical protein